MNRRERERPQRPTGFPAGYSPGITNMTALGRDQMVAADGFEPPTKGL